MPTQQEAPLKGLALHDALVEKFRAIPNAEGRLDCGEQKLAGQEHASRDKLREDISESRIAFPHPGCPFVLLLFKPQTVQLSSAWAFSMGLMASEWPDGLGCLGNC